MVDITESDLKYRVKAVKSERIVVAIYVLSIVCPLLAFPILSFLDGVPSPSLAASIAYSLLFSPAYITYYVPLYFLYIPFGPIPYYPPPFVLLIILSGIASVLFYPIDSYFLWHRYRAAWVLSFASSVFTILFEIYAEPIFADLAPFFVFGVIANFFIIFLLWRCKNEFFMSEKE
jgi:hypothetical protein